MPALEPARLSVGAVRARFANPPRDWSPLQLGDRAPDPDADLRPASVLVPIVDHVAGPSLLLTLRTAHMRKHSGQVAFPGGRAELQDRDAVQTALRESREEVGLDTAHVEVIGSLPDYVTGTGYRVSPIVAAIDPDARFQIDPNEVAQLFEVPLAFLMDPRNHRRHRYEEAGMTRQFLSMPWSAGPDRESFFIWGATAAMIRNLYHFMRAD